MFDLCVWGVLCFHYVWVVWSEMLLSHQSVMPIHFVCLLTFIDCWDPLFWWSHLDMNVYATSYYSVACWHSITSRAIPEGLLFYVFIPRGGWCHTPIALFYIFVPSSGWCHTTIAKYIYCLCRQMWCGLVQITENNVSLLKFKTHFQSRQVGVGCVPIWAVLHSARVTVLALGEWYPSLLDWRRNRRHGIAYGTLWTSAEFAYLHFEK